MPSAPKPFAWSHSVLDMYETCPKKYYHIKVAKDTKDEDSSFSDEGKKTHDALYKRAMYGVQLPLPMRPYERVVKPICDLPGEKHGELKLALNDRLEPVDFFAKDAWVRAIVDYLVVNGNQAVLVDWKTGKPRDGFDQLKLTAAVMSRYMPEVEKFTCLYVWVKYPDDKPSSIVIGKEHMRSIWTDSIERVNEIKDALQTTTFPANPTYLCKWCPVRTCPENQSKAK